jgi:hypothetical protein
MRLEYIKDITDNNYVGINIYADLVYPYLEKLRTIIGDEYDEYVKYQQDRDRGHYHCTVLNVADYNHLVKDLTRVNEINDAINTMDITDFRPIGLGSVEKNGNKAFFVVCRSNQINDFRRSLRKEQIDLHITIGFKHKDVFGLRKNEVLPDVDPFIGTLKQYYFDLDQSFNFLKEVENYEYDLSKDIYCTKITDTYAEFRVGNSEGVLDYFTISIIGDKLRVACKWQSSEHLPYLSNTLINRRFKK